MLLKDSPPNISVADRVYQSIRQDISTATLKPGERLVLRQLAKQFGTSNIPVLEALRRLESDGLAVSHRNAGAQVKVWSESDINGAFMARQALEGVTARLFARYATETERAELVEHGRLFDEACAEADVQGAISADIQLHLFIARCANSGDFDMTNPPLLFRMAENSYYVARAVYSAHQQGSVVHVIKSSAGAHDEMIEALNSGDEARAEEAAEAHVQRAIDNLLRTIIARNSWEIF